MAMAAAQPRHRSHPFGPTEIELSIRRDQMEEWGRTKKYYSDPTEVEAPKLCHILDRLVKQEMLAPDIATIIYKKFHVGEERSRQKLGFILRDLDENISCLAQVIILVRFDSALKSLESPGDLKELALR